MNEVAENRETGENDREIGLNEVKEELRTVKPDESEQIAMSYELHNCIIIQEINDSNVISNSGIIKGDISQDISKGTSAGEEKNSFYDFSNKKGILKFMADYRWKEEFLIFICVAFLKNVPDFLWGDIEKKFEELLSKENGDSDFIKEGEVFVGLDDKLALIHMALVPAECKTYLGKVETKCIVYFNDKIRDRVQKTIWEQDYSLRDRIVSWLTRLKQDEKIGITMGYQIASAFAWISVHDWMFFQDRVFRPLLLERGNRNRNYLVNILSHTLKNNSYQAQLDQMIQSWISNKDTFLWEISYRLYEVNGKYAFNDRVRETLTLYFRRDWKWRCLGGGVYHPKRNPKVDLYPACFNEKLREWVMLILNGFYESCDTFAKKDLLADYFIWLLTEDYKMEGYPKYQLIFLSALERKEIRLKIRKMYWEFWGKYKVRSIWAQILENHFIELERFNQSWDYTKPFFRTIAFTGNPEDYDMVQNSLSNMRRSRKIAKSVKQYLKNLLEKRGD